MMTEKISVASLNLGNYYSTEHLTCKDLEIMAYLEGFDFITQNAITKVELGIRFVPDYELSIFAKILDTTVEDLLTID